MAGSVPPLRLLLLAGCLGAASAQAQTDASTPSASAVPAPATSDPAASASASEKLTKLFAGTPPKLNTPKPDTVAPVAATTPVDQPRNSIVHLPTYVVRSTYRLPDEEHMLTAKGGEDAIVKRYVGEPTDLDVLLNKYTINTLWKKIPLLGSISVFDSVDYKQRVVLDYSRIEAKRLYTEALGVSADVPAAPAKQKDEKAAAVSTDK